MGGVGLGGGVPLASLAVYSGRGIGINNVGLFGVGDMVASKANGRPAIAAGVLCGGPSLTFPSG